MARLTRLFPVTLLSLSLAGAGGAALVVGAFACDHGEPPRLVRAEAVIGVPMDIAFYPHVYYGGEDAYLVDGRWFRPDADGWVVFTDVPLELELVCKSLRSKSNSLFGQ
jgi:hypothetical protein